MRFPLAVDDTRGSQPRIRAHLGGLTVVGQERFDSRRSLPIDWSAREAQCRAVDHRRRKYRDMARGRHRSSSERATPESVAVTCGARGRAEMSPSRRQRVSRARCVSDVIELTRRIVRSWEGYATPRHRVDDSVAPPYDAMLEVGRRHASHVRAGVARATSAPALRADRLVDSPVFRRFVRALAVGTSARLTARSNDRHRRL
jgi:hypothetical protein